jgi:hypothetical protein
MHTSRTNRFRSPGSYIPLSSVGIAHRRERGRVCLIEKQDEKQLKTRLERGSPSLSFPDRSDGCDSLVVPLVLLRSDCYPNLELLVLGSGVRVSCESVLRVVTQNSSQWCHQSPPASAALSSTGPSQLFVLCHCLPWRPTSL